MTAERGTSVDEESYRELLDEYGQRKGEIERRLEEFERVGQRPFKVLFSEMCFCLLTPQSRARACDAAVRELQKKGMLYKGSWEEIADRMSGVRFHENKARYIVEARELFTSDWGFDLDGIVRKGTKAKTLREWFVKNVKGLGYKEASHFLRNVGVGFDLAILDRHILGNLLRYGVIDSVPQNMTRKQYLDIEKKMRKFAKKVDIEMGALDLLFWSMETGEVFK
ncbi:MAG: N-glycosylase/DNA lyase [Methanomassiliicoccales archaeon]|nr:MAG: N-glycosylase/DNA lyase [Methanomassiliicoccales archaeon]